MVEEYQQLVESRKSTNEIFCFWISFIIYIIMSKCAKHFYFSKCSSSSNNWLKNIGHFFQCNTSTCSRISDCPYNTECAITNKKIYTHTKSVVNNKRYLFTSRFIFIIICCRRSNCWWIWGWCTWGRIGWCTRIIYIKMLLFIFRCAMCHWNLFETWKILFMTKWTNHCFNWNPLLICTAYLAMLSVLYEKRRKKKQYVVYASQTIDIERAEKKTYGLSWWTDG